jgi:GNAT superfamily N-acetyltransferase
MTFVVRKASIQDIALLEAVELKAAERFNTEKLLASLAKRTVHLSQLQAAQAAGTLWVASAEDYVIVGFLLAEVLDNNLHVSEMSVVPSHGRQGIGSALLDAATTHALTTSRRVSLTTFATVPWNGPFYAQRGFREMSKGEIGAGLAARLQQEAELGLVSRVAMCRCDA